MKITRRQLRKIINEAMYDPQTTFDKHFQSLDPEIKQKVQTLIDTGNVEQAHSLVDTLADYKGPAGSFDSYQDIQDQKQMFRDSTKARILDYLPNFDKLPENYQNAMLDYILECEGQTMHLEIDTDQVEGYAYVAHEEYISDLQNNSKNYPAQLYYIFALTQGKEWGDKNNPFSKIDPSGNGSSRIGFYGFISAHERTGQTDSEYDINEAIIQMLRDFLPNVREVVIN